MNAITPAPLRKPVPLNNPAMVEYANDALPADPTLILAQPLPSPRARHNLFRNIAIAVGVLFAAEVLLPFAMKPSVVVGDAVARYHFRTMTVINDKELELREQASVAETVGGIEAARAQVAGFCALGALLDSQMAWKCRQIADQAFDAAAESARNSRRN